MKHVMSIAIVDDFLEDRVMLAGDLNSFFGNIPNASIKVAEFKTGEEMLEVFEKGAYDLAFLDICLDPEELEAAMGDAGAKEPSGYLRSGMSAGEGHADIGMTDGDAVARPMNGIALARKLRAADTEVQIVFLTTSAEFAFDAFPVHPFDYLIKPYEKSRLEYVLNEFLRVRGVSEQEILIRAAHSSYKVPISKIVSVFSYGHSLEITLEDGKKIRSIMTFGELQKKLEDDPRFLLCNRGVLANMDYVLSLGEDQLRMKTGPSRSLRVRGRSKLISEFSQYQISRLKRG